MSGPESHLLLDSGIKAEADTPNGGGKIGIAVRDAVNRRLIEGVAGQLGLTSSFLSEEMLQSAAGGAIVFEPFELIVADEPLAASMRLILQTSNPSSEIAPPALVAVRRPDAPMPPIDQEGTQPFEGILVLPQEPAVLLAQLSVILYAHRAFLRHYQSALEELHLNRRIFRSVTSGISVANATLPDIPLVYVNPAFEVMTGYTLEEVQGNNCRFLQGDDRQQPGVTLLREAIQSRREVVVLLKNYRKDGSLFWNELSLSPIFNRERELTHFVGIQNDVTARVEFEAALRESEKLAAVGRLAASIAHEINNPLEAVTNLLYLARHAEDAPEREGYLDQADKELRRASLITSQSLRFYKQSTKAQAIKPTEMLDAVLDLYQGKLDNAHVTVHRRERMTESIVCFESEIRQVLTNLIRNAIDALTGERRRMLVRSREATEWQTGSKGAIITIADTGSGISPETMKHLFTAFFTTKGISGTGLGLWVSTEIIKRHHGSLKVRSSQRPGNSWTVFQLFLPYQGFAS
jgi:two-component system sporulation sensor kinase C